MSKKNIFLLAIFFTVTMIAYAYFVLGSYSQCFSVQGAPDSLGLSFGYTKKEVLIFLQARTIPQLTCYINFIKIWDTIFPAVYTTMGVLWIIYFFNSWRYLIIIPLCHMVLDWAENFIEITMVHQYINNGLNESLIFAGSIATMMKWSLSILTYLVIIYGMFIKFKLFLKSPKPFQN